LVGQQEGHTACKKLGVGFVGGDIDWNFAHPLTTVVTTTSIILAPIKFRMETFWYWLTYDHLENGR